MSLVGRRSAGMPLPVADGGGRQIPTSSRPAQQSDSCLKTEKGANRVRLPSKHINEAAMMCRRPEERGCEIFQRSTGPRASPRVQPTRPSPAKGIAASAVKRLETLLQSLPNARSRRLTPGTSSRPVDSLSQLKMFCRTTCRLKPLASL